MAAHNETGTLGESLACDFLKKKGYTLLAQNYRHGRAEIDIIAREAKTLIIIEVKTLSHTYNNPDEAVDKRKLQLMAKGATAYMMANHIDCEVRYDIVSVKLGAQPPVIEHFMDVYIPFDLHSDEF